MSTKHIFCVFFRKLTAWLRFLMTMLGAVICLIIEYVLAFISAKGKVPERLTNTLSSEVYVDYIFSTLNFNLEYLISV